VARRFRKALPRPPRSDCSALRPARCPRPGECGSRRRDRLHLQDMDNDRAVLVPDEELQQPYRYLEHEVPEGLDPASPGGRSAVSRLSRGSSRHASVPDEEDNQRDFENRNISANLSMKQPGTFIAGHGDDHKEVTRQQMIEYLSLMKWSRASCRLAPLAIALWLILLVVVAVRAHTEASFRVREAISTSLLNITADRSRGEAPARIFTESTANKVSCKCSCAYERGAVCLASGGRNTRFDGEITIAELQRLRQRAAYNDTYAKSQVLRWDDLRSIPDVWFWLQHGMLPYVWKEEKHSTPVDLGGLFADLSSQNGTIPSGIATNPGLMLHWNQVIGGARLRSRRLKEMACRVDNAIITKYQKDCHSDEAMLNPWGPGLSSYTPGYIPTEGVSGAYDVHFDIQRPAHAMFEQIQHMLKAYSWLDSATSSMYLQMAFLNAESDPPLFGLLELRFDFERSGSVKKTIHVDTIAADPYPSAFHLLLDIVWIGGVLLLLGRQCYVVFCMKEVSPWDKWVILDWVTLFSSLCLIVNFFLINSETSGVAQATASLPKAPEGDQATPEALRLYHIIWDEVLDRIINLTVWYEYHRLTMFWYTLLLTLQFFSVFRGQPKLAQLAKTVLHAGEDLMHYMVLFIIIFLNFAFAGLMLFGLNMEEWSTPGKAINTSFQTLTGYIDIATMYEVAPISTIVWVSLFVMSMLMVMVNLLLATICDHFTIIKARADSNTGIGMQFRFLLRDFLCRPKLDRRASTRQQYPLHDTMLKEIISRAKLPDSMSHAINQSVIEPKFVRTERENHLFSGKMLDDTGDGNQATKMVQKDFEELGVNPYYADLLQLECHRFCQTESNPEERRVAQLRELVCMAEADIGLMRTRLATCQDITGTNMRKLSRRLMDLETMVHNNLVQLVDIADTTGVPVAGDKKKKRDSRRLFGRTGTVSMDQTVDMSATELIAKYGRNNRDRRHEQTSQYRRGMMEEGDVEPMMENIKPEDLKPMSPQSPHVTMWGKANRDVGVAAKRLGPKIPFR